LPTSNKKDIEILKQIASNFPLRLLAVGGFVRDFLLKREPKDIDFLVIADNKSVFDTFIAKVESDYKLHKVIPSGFDKTIRLVSKNKCYDFTFTKEENLQSNLLNRDFTINAIAMDLKSENIVNVTTGLKDLKNKTIKQVNNDIFTQDPVRILRMYRFKGELNFSIEEKTEKNAVNNLSLLKKPAGERIKEELFKIFANDSNKPFVEPLFNHLIFHLFPKFKTIIGIPQNGYHHLNVLDHIKSVVSYTFDIPFLTNHFKNFSYRLTKEDKFALRLAAVFHDLGKGQTYKVNEKGLTTFHNHQYISADLFKEEVKFLNLSNTFKERVYFLIRRHMLFLNFMINGYSEKSFRKFINLMREDTILLLLLVTADKLSAKGPLSKGNMEKLIKVGNDFLEVYNKDKESILNLPKLISGKEVMEIMGISPSKTVGEILNTIAEKQLENKSFSRKDALLLLNSLKKGKK
jgi:tRNA nucleotidyltransferase/poly(A) polymerase